MEAAKVEEDWIIRTNKIIDITKKELPALTDDGFKIVDVPRELLGALREAYENGLSDKIPEHERFDPLEMGILPVRRQTAVATQGGCCRKSRVGGMVRLAGHAQ